MLGVKWREGSALHIFLGALLQVPQIPVAMQLPGAFGNAAVVALLLFGKME